MLVSRCVLNLDVIYACIQVCIKPGCDLSFYPGIKPGCDLSFYPGVYEAWM